jgi:hypothetical protein
MTQPPRTTESISRDNAAIRDIMHQIRELTVPDRATLALGLIGHLATMMNRSQMAKLLGELLEEAERVQDVPPARQQDREQRIAAASGAAAGEGGAPAGDAAAGGAGSKARGTAGPSDHASARAGSTGRTDDARGDYRAVGQAGRGEFTSGDLV